MASSPASRSGEGRMTSLRSFVVLAYALTWVLLGPWFHLFTVVYGKEPS